MTEYIEREAARKAAKMINVVPVPPTISESVSVVSVLDIFRLPAADVAPVVHAYWFIGEDYECFTCSHCGHNHFTGAGNRTRAKAMLQEKMTPYYCDYCGAKMDGDAHV